MPRSTLRSAFPAFAVSTAMGFLCTFEVALPRCDPSGAPSLGFLPSTFLWIQARFRSRLIFVHLKAYELSPVQLLPPLRPTHGSTYRYASKFKVFRICDSFFKDLVPPTEESFLLNLKYGVVKKGKKYLVTLINIGITKQMPNNFL